MSQHMRKERTSDGRAEEEKVTSVIGRLQQAFVSSRSRGHVKTMAEDGLTFATREGQMSLGCVFGSQ